MTTRQASDPSRVSPHQLFPEASLPCSLGVRRIPTPLEQCPRMGADLGIELLVKREDLIDDLGCGHKSRKLGYVVADAVDRGATALVTAASLPSSQAVGIAAYGSEAGLSTHIIYCGDAQQRPMGLRGNYLLTALFGATITWRERSRWIDWPVYVQQVCDRQAAQGETPYVAPPGLSNWPGVLGSVELGMELASQIPDPEGRLHVVIAAGSGGTCLGVAVAAHAMGLPWTVHGICVGGPRESTAREIRRAREEAISALGSGIVPAHAVRVYDVRDGHGYDDPQPAEFDVIRRALARYRLPLDPTYTVKVFIGLERLVARGEIPRGSSVVLVHTGGTLGLYTGGPAVDRWAVDRFPQLLA